MSRGVGLAAEAAGPVARLAAGGRFTFLGRLVRPEPGVAYTRFALELKTTDLQGRPHDGRATVIRATAFDKDRRRIRYWPNLLIGGTVAAPDWTSASIVVPWSPDLGMMRLEIANVGRSGLLEIRKVTIEPLVDASWYPWIRFALVAGWVALTAAAAFAAIRWLRPRAFGLVAATGGVGLMIAAILPQPVFDGLADPFERPLVAMVRAVSDLVPERPPPAEPPAAAPLDAPAAGPATAPPPARQAPREDPAASARPPEPPGPPAAGPALSAAEAVDIARDGASWLRRQLEGNTLHAAGFALLAFFSIGFARLPLHRVILAVAAVAAATEAAQLFTITRDADLNDIVVDATGAFAGVLAGIALRHAYSAILDRRRRPPA